MSLWDRVRNFFVTDIEILLSQDKENPWMDWSSSTVGGGALTVVGHEEKFRVIFHGGYLGGPGSYKIFRKKNGEELKIRRTASDSVDVIFADQATSLSLRIGEEKPVPFSNGTMRAKRIRHKHFELFPR